MHWLLLLPTYALETDEALSHLTVTGAKYQLRFSMIIFDLGYAVRDAAARWVNILCHDTAIELGLDSGQEFASARGTHVFLTQRRMGEGVVIGVTALLNPFEEVGTTVAF